MVSLQFCSHVELLFHSVMVIETVTQVQTLDGVDCILHNCNDLGKGMNPIILPPAMAK